MFCLSCGKEIPDGSQFCLQCGKPTTGFIKKNIWPTFAAMRKIAREAVIFMLLGWILLTMGRFVYLCAMTPARTTNIATLPTPQQPDLQKPLDADSASAKCAKSVSRNKYNSPADLGAISDRFLQCIKGAPDALLQDDVFVGLGGIPNDLAWCLEDIKTTPSQDNTPNGSKGILPDTLAWCLENTETTLALAHPDRFTGPKTIPDDSTQDVKANPSRPTYLDSFEDSLIIGILGFPAGLGLWIFYRVFRFAIKG